MEIIHGKKIPLLRVEWRHRAKESACKNRTCAQDNCRYSILKMCSETRFPFRLLTLFFPLLFIKRLWMLIINLALFWTLAIEEWASDTSLAALTLRWNPQMVIGALKEIKQAWRVPVRHQCGPSGQGPPQCLRYQSSETFYSVITRHCLFLSVRIRWQNCSFRSAGYLELFGSRLKELAVVVDR